jgi:hypothetical protein
VEEVHVTGLREFLRCRRKWWYGHERKLELAGGYHSMAMGTGSGFHGGQRFLYELLKQGQLIGPDELDMAADKIEEVCRTEGGDPMMAEDMMRHYWREFGCKEQIDEIVQVELPLSYTHELFTLKGTMDLVYRRNDRYVVRDYKTVDSVSDDGNYIRLDFQFQVYAFLIWKHYGKPVELEVVKVRRKVPPGFGATPVRRNKDGKISKNNASTDPNDYVKIIPWYFSVPQLQEFEGRLKGVLESISAERRIGLWPRSDQAYGPGACTGCQFFELCGRELMEGPLSDDDIEVLYTRKESREDTPTRL